MTRPCRVWDTEAWLHVQPTRADPDRPLPMPTAHGRLRIMVNEDDSWDVAVKRDGQTFDLILRGHAGSPTGGALNEILSWLFGVPA